MRPNTLPTEQHPEPPPLSMPEQAALAGQSEAFADGLAYLTCGDGQEKIMNIALCYGVESHEAKDIAQVVTMRALGAIIAKSTAITITAEKTIQGISTITVNVLRDRHRKSIAYARPAPDLCVDFSSAEYVLPPQAIDPISDWIERQAMAAAVNVLSFQQKQIIAKVYYEGLTLAQAADVLDIPLGTAKSRLHVAIKSLRKQFTTDD